MSEKIICHWRNVHRWIWLPLYQRLSKSSVLIMIWKRLTSFPKHSDSRSTRLSPWSKYVAKQMFSGIESNYGEVPPLWFTHSLSIIWLFLLLLPRLWSSILFSSSLLSFLSRRVASFCPFWSVCPYKSANPDANRKAIRRKGKGWPCKATAPPTHPVSYSSTLFVLSTEEIGSNKDIP